jgi:hypothetical protein
MRERFELDWMGGPAAARFRRLRPGTDALPWDSLDPRAFPGELVQRARLSWTEGAVGEYTSAAAFAALLRDLLEARAPLDLVGMASEFVADELMHCELNARLAMALGGAAPFLVDLEALVPPVDAAAPPLERAVERAVRLCCVGEALSSPLLAGTAAVAAHPLTRAVLGRIARDEPAHGRLGFLVLGWAAPRLGAGERARLARIALETAVDYAPTWRTLPESDACGAFARADVHALGWMEPRRYRATARRALARIERDLRRAGLPAEGFAATAFEA